MVAECGEARGQWSESTRGVSGAISGRVGDGRFSGAVNGGGFTAAVSLRATGRSLAMRLIPSGGDVARVDARLSRWRVGKKTAKLSAPAARP